MTKRCQLKPTYPLRVPVIACRAGDERTAAAGETVAVSLVEVRFVSTLPFEQGELIDYTLWLSRNFAGPRLRCVGWVKAVTRPHSSRGAAYEIVSTVEHYEFQLQRGLAALAAGPGLASL